MTMNDTETMTTLAASDPNSTSLATPDTFASTHDFEQITGLIIDFRETALTDWDWVHLRGATAYTHWNAVNIARLALALWISLTHLAIIVFILVMPKLRSQPKNLLIVSVCLAHLLLAAVLLAKLSFTLWPHLLSCDLALGWVFVADYYQTCVSLCAVLFLVAERLIYVYFTEKKQKTMNLLCRIVSTVTFSLLPWAAACLLLLPMFLAALLGRSVEPGTCFFKVDDGLLLGCQMLSFLPPSLGVFVMTPFTGLLDCIMRPRHCAQPHRPATPRGESSTVTVVITLVSVFCELPFAIARVLVTTMECNSPECSRLLEGLSLAWWLRLGKAAVFPFIWLAYTDIREAMGCRLDWDYLCGEGWEVEPWGPVYGGDDDHSDGEDEAGRRGDDAKADSFPLTTRA